jgi:hypothetical protein
LIRICSPKILMLSVADAGGAVIVPIPSVSAVAATAPAYFAIFTLVSSRLREVYPRNRSETT